MSCLSGVDASFFYKVLYAPELNDRSAWGKCEAAADVCRAPTRWVAAEFWGGAQGHLVTYLDDQQEELSVQEIEIKATKGFKRVARILVGLFLCLPGQLAALPLMRIAYVSEEIRLKHQITVRELAYDERQTLKELIQKRQELANERQGCFDPASLLCTICSLLCYLVCCRD